MQTVFIWVGGFLGGSPSLELVGGANFIHPHPPTPENTLLGLGGGIKEGGRTKSCRGGLQNNTPPPLPEKGLLAEMGGRGGRI